MSDQSPNPRVMPRGGRKGGAVFPRIELEKCLVWAKKLVSKTHIGPQPQDVIYSGVVGSKSGSGDIKISCLKQYGYLEGNAKGYEATQFAKQTIASPADELQPLYAQAALRPTIFKKLFETFHDDTVSRARLKQRASDLNVHPEETEKCVDIYVQTLAFAGLISMDGDKIIHSSQSGIKPATSPIDGGPPQDNDEEIDDGRGAAEEEHPRVEDQEEYLGQPSVSPRNHRAVVHVNVTLDSTMDADKLEKQLKMLRKYGAI